MFKTLIKSIFRIEYLLILISVFAFTSTLIFKNTGTKNLYELDLMISELEVEYSTTPNSKIFTTNALEYCNFLNHKFLPLTYYNEAIDNQLSSITSQILHASDDPDFAKKFLSDCVELQKLIQLNQKELNFGYESLLISSLFLLFIAIAVIVYKNFVQKNELEKLHTIENAQKKFSRDLHDGAAQDLAALKLYIQNDEKDKAAFYAEHAFKEVRYLIDSTHLDLTAGFEEVIKETLASFEKNFAIKTEYFCASQGIKKISPEVQIELLRIIQEALSNSARHSKADLITIRITDVVNQIRFTISDNGTGLSENEIEKANNDPIKNHYGLKNMKDRIAAINGSVEFINAGGTTIAITLQNPLHR